MWQEHAFNKNKNIRWHTYSAYTSVRVTSYSYGKMEKLGYQNSKTPKTWKYCLWRVQTGVLQIQDGGQPPSWKKIEKRPYLGNDLTDRHQIWYIEAN